MLRDRRNAIIWALAMWFVRRTVRKRSGASGGHGKLRRFVLAVLKLGVVGGIAFVVWRKYFADRSKPTAA